MTMPTDLLSGDDVVLRFLKESGVASDLGLREALDEIRQLTTTVAPDPSAELASLLLAGAPPILLSSRRRTIALVTIVAVTASLGLGVSTAAAVSPDFRRAATDAVTAIVHAVVPRSSNPAPPTPARLPSAPPSPTTVTTPNPAPAQTPQPTPSTGSRKDYGTSHRPVVPPGHSAKPKPTHPPHPTHP